MDIRWAARARDDLFQIADYYDEIRPGFGDEILSRIEQAPQAMHGFPRVGTPLDLPDLRKWRVKDTPYLLLYRVTGGNIEVARVIHISSNWKPNP